MSSHTDRRPRTKHGSHRSAKEERLIKKLKKDPKVDNPFALARSIIKREAQRVRSD